jgi:anti-sigma factor RsiW
MAEMHPSEIELLEYVEGELEDRARVGVHAHVESCPQCTARVAELERAREVLRSLPLIELPKRRREAILAGLPKQERDRPVLSGLFASPRRLLVAVLVPVAAVVVAVIVVTTTGGNGEQQAAVPEAGKTSDLAGTAEVQAAPAPGAGGGEAAAPPAEAAPEAPTATEAPAMESALAPVASVAGPPADVGKLLEQKGLSFTIAGPDRIEVTGATEDEVRQALEGLPEGPVQVFVLPG